MPAAKLSREQVFYLCEEVEKIRALPNGSHGPLENRESVREVAKRKLADALGMAHTHGLYKIADGLSPRYRHWVAEWHKSRSGSTGPVAPAMHQHKKRVTREQKAWVRARHKAGVSVANLVKASGISETVIKRIVGLYPADSKKRLAVVTTKPVRLAARTARVARQEDWGQNFKAYVEAEEEKARAALAEKHEAEREELNDKLKAKRQAVIDRLLNLYTAPEPE